jgi:hypothetical protein
MARKDKNENGILTQPDSPDLEHTLSEKSSGKIGTLLKKNHARFMRAAKKGTKVLNKSPVWWTRPKYAAALLSGLALTQTGTFVQQYASKGGAKVPELLASGQNYLELLASNSIVADQISKVERWASTAMKRHDLLEGVESAVESAPIFKEVLEVFKHFDLKTLYETITNFDPALQLADFGSKTIGYGLTGFLGFLGVYFGVKYGVPAAKKGYIGIAKRVRPEYGNRLQQKADSKAAKKKAMDDALEQEIAATNEWKGYDKLARQVHGNNYANPGKKPKGIKGLKGRKIGRWDPKDSYITLPKGRKKPLEDSVNEAGNLDKPKRNYTRDKDISDKK